MRRLFAALMRSLRDIDRILRGEATRLPDLHSGRIRLPVGGLIVVLVVLAMLYGACMGSFALFRRDGPVGMQMLATALKVPALFFLMLLITCPSLYVFNALVGSRLDVRAVMHLLIASLAVNVALLASLGPIVAFFSVSTTNYNFMVLLNVLVFAISGALGLKFLLQTLHRLSVAQTLPPDAFAGHTPTAGGDLPLQNPHPGEQPDESQSAEEVDDDDGEDHSQDPPKEESGNAGGPNETAAAQPAGPAELGALERMQGQVLGSHVKTVFRIWMVVFGLVGAQMGWVLRPFIGDPSLPFQWFRQRESNFFEAVFASILALFT